METDSLTNEVHQRIFRYFPQAPRPLRPDMHFERDLGGDSMNFVELIMEIETVFGISLPDKEMVSLQTVGQLDALVREKTTRPSVTDQAP